MFLEDTPSYSKVKKIYGKSNQYLNTTLIALDHFSKSNMENTLGDRVFWEPRNKKESIQISKVFIRKMYLSVITDMIDFYLKDIVNSSGYLFDINFHNEFHGAKGVRDRVNLFYKEFPNIQSLMFSFVDFIISWRNQITHSNYEHGILKNSKKELLAHKEDIGKHYSNTNICFMIDNFEKNSDIRHKELLSLNSAAIEFINDVDKEVLKRFDKDKFVKVIMTKVKKNKTKFNNLLNQDNNRKSNYIIGLLQQYGFKENTKRKYEESDKRSRFKEITPITLVVDEISSHIFL